MQDLRTRWLHGAVASAGLGALAGGLEAVGDAFLSRAPLGPGGMALLGAAAVAVMALGGLAAGLVAGVGHLVAPEPAAGRGAQMGLAAGLLGAWYAVPAASVLAAEGRLPAALLMAAAPLALALLVGLNVRFLARRAEEGAPAPIGWLPLCGGLAAVLVLGATAKVAVRAPVGPPAGRSVVIVTIDGLGTPDVFADGAPLGPLVAGAVRYREAVSPLPAARPAAATVLTSLHPLRHEVLDDLHALSRGWTPFPEIAAAAGWGTAAFVSSSVLGVGSGLSQGFGTYDDAVRAGPWWSLSVVRRLPLGVARRTPEATVSAFRAWLAGQGDHGFVAWVHLDASAGAAGVVAALTDLDAAVAARGDTLEIVASSYGASAQGLGEPAVHVPLWIRAPGLAATVPDVTAQVRLMDVAPTAAAWLGLPTIEPSEGVDLLGYATGARVRSMSCTLVGEDADGHALVGLRSSGVKYVRTLPDGPERLYDLASDPAETRDLSTTQVAALEQARGLVSVEETALRALQGGGE